MDSETSDDPAPDGVPAPLDGLIVADLSRVLAGPYCSMLLADLGATVIKVESPSGDDTRTWMPPENDGVATYYQSINRNKRSIVLDFGDRDDLLLAQELLRRADIAIENFRPGSLAKFGLDYGRACELNPRLIYLSITGFGAAEGAWLPGYDLVVQAVSGLMSLTGEPDGPAYRSGVAVFDVMTGLHGTIGVLAALQHRADHRAVVSTSRSTCCRRRCRDSSTSRRPTPPGASCRTAWATPIPACTRTSRCRRRIAT